VNAARVFVVGGVISYRALFGFLHPAVFIPTLLVAPVFQILLFAYIGRSAGVESDEFYVVGNALHSASLPCLWAMTHAIAGERFQQTLGYIFASPAPRLPLFLGRALPVVANGFFVAAFAFAVGGLILGIDVPLRALPSIALVTAIAALACTGLGLVNAALGLVIRDVSLLSNVLYGFLLVFSGANVPLDELPDPIAAASHGLPLRHGIEAARRLADGATLGDVGGLVAAEALVGGVYAVGGFALIRAFERLSRRRATLEIV
jgi:ABC-2 type transport system permease protein